MDITCPNGVNAGGETNKRTSKQINDISPKMLNETLKRLVDYKMVQRKVYPEVPPRVEYCLTKFGKSTADPLAALLDWSVENEEILRSLFERFNQKA